MKFLPDALTIAANFLIKLVFQHRLIVSFIKRDLSTRYLGSTLGLLWAVIHPLALLISYTFIFAILFRPGFAGGRYSEHFVLYLFAGLLPWLYFQDTVQRSATTLIEHSNLIRRTVFPSEILPVVIAGSNIVTRLIGVGLLLGPVRVRPEDAAPVRGPHTRPRVLVVDDSRDARGILKHFLKATYAVEAVPNAKTALHRAHQQRYDAVLLDINLGDGTSGLDVLRALRALPNYAEVPIIAVTAYALPEDRNRFMKKGFDGYLSKPFLKTTLLETLEQTRSKAAPAE